MDELKELNDLPEDVLLNIFEFADCHDLWSLSETCKRFSDIISMDKTSRSKMCLRLENTELSIDNPFVDYLIKSGSKHFNVKLSNVTIAANSKPLWEHLSQYVAELTLTNCVFNADWEILFNNVPKLKKLRLYFCRETSSFASLMLIHTYTKLTHIKVINSNLGLNFYRLLSVASPNLNTLEFPHSIAESPHVLELLKTIRNMKSIVVSDEIFSYASENEMIECTNNSLESLSLYNKCYNFFGSESFKNVLLRSNAPKKFVVRTFSSLCLSQEFKPEIRKKIEEIILYGYNDTASFDGISDMTALKRLEMHSQLYHVGWINFDFGVAPLPRLKHLVFDFGSSQCLITPEVIHRIGNICTQLETLDLGFCSPEILLTAFKALKNLKEFKVSNHYGNTNEVLGVNIFNDIKLMADLEVLELKGYTHFFDDEVLRKNFDFPKLRRLSIWRGRKITDEGVRYLCHNCPNLQELELVRLPEITNISILFIGKKLKDLTLLNVIYNVKLTHKCLPHIRDNCKHLRKIFVPDHFYREARNVLAGMRKLQIY